MVSQGHMELRGPTYDQVDAGTKQLNSQNGHNFDVMFDDVLLPEPGMFNWEQT